MRHTVGPDVWLLSGTSFVMASYLLTATVLRALRNWKRSANETVTDKGNCFMCGCNKQSDLLKPCNTDEGNTMAGLCDDPETPVEPTEDPERAAFQELAHVTDRAARAQILATLTLVRAVKKQNQILGSQGNPPTMRSKDTQNREARSDRHGRADGGGAAGGSP